MKMCGVEIKGKEAIICLLSSNNGLYEISDCRVRSLVLQDPDSGEGLRAFQKAFAKLAEDYRVDHIVIRERMKTGKFSGSADGFKMEAVLQLIENVNVSLISASRSKELIKAHPLPIRFSETQLKAFQETAFITAYVALANLNQHGAL